MVESFNERAALISGADAFHFANASGLVPVLNVEVAGLVKA